MNKRHHEILTCVVDHFIDFHQPISSNMVLEKLSIQLSSATVRQVFLSLDKGGYLSKLHTSSGRIPTEKGYRMYVDHLPGDQSCFDLDHYINGDSYQLKFRSLFDHLLSKLMEKLPYVLMIQLNDYALSDVVSLKYVSINSHYGLVLLFHRFGFVTEHYVRFDGDVSELKVDGLIQWLCHQLKNRNDIKIPSSYSKDEAYFMSVIIDEIFNQSSHSFILDDIMIKNVNACLKLSDYSDKASIQSFLSVLDDKQLLHQLMGFKSKSLEIKIGQELLDDRLLNSSLISIPICIDGDIIACLGVLGPSRMDYLAIVKLLSSKETLAELIQV